MQIKFDARQQYQIDAVEAVCGLFEGQPRAAGATELRMDAPPGELFSDLGLGNRIVLSDAALLANCRAVQAHSGLPQSEALELLPGAEGAGADFPNFSVEMETGTGKTYVYLRTVFELHARHGFKKFIIVVPTVAIREGVLQAIDLTREHFRMLYDNTPLDSWVYNSDQVSRLRGFATGTNLQLLVINIDAFNKATNKMQRDDDRMAGRRPIEFIQATSPIVILDEPQNMESPNARAAIASLAPALTLRYSATHRNPYNLLYKLDPVQAYDLRLVKRIEVDSVIDARPDFNRPYIKVVAVAVTRTSLTARIEIDVQGSKGPVRKTITVRRNGDDLFDLSGEREVYRGYRVNEINAGANFVSFSNGVRVEQGQSIGGASEDLMRVQVEETVREHFDKERRIARLPEGQRLKVLSLFFIDRVANYAAEDGKIRRWFIEAYGRIAAREENADLNPLPVELVHNGYFAGGKERDRWKDSREGTDTRSSTAADDEAYRLIMQDKPRLLSRDEPLRFIFSHSALREGWDNPNVFQICTLNESRSELRKRQEIGRGLRLPVRENGERCFDEDINRLTVIANESYRDFAATLQEEIEQECGVTFEGRIANARERRRATLRENWRHDPYFEELWQRISVRTRYAVQFDTEKLIQSAAEYIQTNLGRIEKPQIVAQKAEVVTTAAGLSTVLRHNRQAETREVEAIPDVLEYLQRHTELTRATLAEILIRSGRLAELPNDPQQFMDRVLGCIRHVLALVMVDGVKYEKIDGETYEMLRFEEHEVNGYAGRMIDTPTNGLYDAVECDSEVEKTFARALESRTDIKLFLKLPRWFKIETPLGSYNPDWAIVKDGDTPVYLVRETKGTSVLENVPESERDKIKCGKAHFKALGVSYELVSTPAEV